ncbi:MAG: M48 family metalloprotease, partial [Pseudomonadales bacterium]
MIWRFSRHFSSQLRLGAAVAFAVTMAGVVHGAPPKDLPVLGDASSSLISPEMERQIGRDFLKQIHASLPTIDDPLLKHYVAKHIADLSQYSQLKEKVLSTVLIDSDQINAFAVPGGVVGINLGLFLYGRDVHEYSSVVAHELAHLSQRHFARGVEEQRAQAIPNLAAMLAAILLGAAGGGDAAIAAISTVQAVAQSRQLRYSRGRETEADRIGLNTMVRANMDPDGMARMFGRMQRAYRFSSTPPEFLLTHPLSETRVADARSQTQQYPKRTYPEDLDYAMMRARADIYYMDGTQAAVTKYARAAQEEPGSISAQYGYAVALSRAGDHEKALQIAEALFERDPQKLLYIGTYAEFLIAAKQSDEAAQLLAHQLVINPDNAPLSMFYARALTESERFTEAEAVLLRQSRVNKGDIDVWYNLAEVAGLAGNIISVHRARA